MTLDKLNGDNSEIKDDYLYVQWHSLSNVTGRQL